MNIYLYKNETGHITAFQSHIQHPENWPKDNLRTIADTDYQPLLYYLTGRDHVKEDSASPHVRFGDLGLRDEGDYIEEHMKITKKVRDLQIIQ